MFVDLGICLDYRFLDDIVHTDDILSRDVCV
jgi:hypothetical protein